MISLMGLFGLVLFTSTRRTRETGIRKAMGANVTTIVQFLVREYPIRIIIAAAFALPASWYFARKWLENFTLRTGIDD